MTDSKVLNHLLAKLTDDLAAKGTPTASITRLQECIKSTIHSLPTENPLLKTAQQTLRRPPTPHESGDLTLLSWLVEIFHTSFRLEYDVMSSSLPSSETQGETEPRTEKQQRQLWHHRPDVGLTAINDACLLRTSVMILLRKEMREHPAYLTFLDLFREARYRMEVDVLRGAVSANTGTASSSAGVGTGKEGYKLHLEGEKKKLEMGIATGDGAFCRDSLPVALALEYTSFADMQ
ncbi:hypothetical protein P170DRAFT_509722 [Aspergillus steynii IBT 23096]|uniref:Uncharacterized protein n=1 Tax=Aspergillus steynii IBT 23096 TaxID=1392250 RepID=A0A2I2G889_9EURO|nr:uncharacterized protein P170DRAFT_509722 [Aspergillus steynii IBT 23096]PLB49091.1 hypothetical protein P170DRAFT_509722 [Aspergillus steynii IBT 23096]